jgi:hypothetical protein
MVGGFESHKMSHAVIGNHMTFIDNHMHVAYLEKLKKY